MVTAIVPGLAVIIQLQYRLPLYFATCIEQVSIPFMHSDNFSGFGVLDFWIFGASGLRCTTLSGPTTTQKWLLPFNEPQDFI